LDLKEHFQLAELFLESIAKLVRLVSELSGHPANLNLIDAILGNIINDLIHLNEQLRSYGQLVHYLRFHAHIVTLVLPEKSASGANSHSILNTYYFHLAFMFLTQLLLRSYCICLNFTALFSRSNLSL
jgi:hypothetical protein